MYVVAATAEEYWDFISRARREICEEIGLDASSEAAQPLPHATYVIGMEEGATEPCAMAELYSYEQAFHRYEDAIYSQATDLSRLAPIGELAHLRSVYMDPQKRATRMFGYICVGLAKAASLLGARFVTAGTNVQNDKIVALHAAARLKVLGHYRIDGGTHQLALLDVEEVLQRAGALRRQSYLRIDPEVVRNARSRRRAGL